MARSQEEKGIQITNIPEHQGQHHVKILDLPPPKFPLLPFHCPLLPPADKERLPSHLSYCDSDGDGAGDGGGDADGYNEFSHPCIPRRQHLRS